LDSKGREEEQGKGKSTNTTFKILGGWNKQSNALNNQKYQKPTSEEVNFESDNESHLFI